MHAHHLHALPLIAIAQYDAHIDWPHEPLDELDGLEGLVHVAHSEVEAEVHHRLVRALVGVL